MGEPPARGRSERRYKGYRIYAYIALARLFSELDLTLDQPELERRAAEALGRYQGHVSKEEILHAIRSNSHMTDKVIEYLTDEGFANVRRDDRGYDIRITPSGALHLRQFDRLYRELYARELKEHYRFVRPPDWLTPSTSPDDRSRVAD
jgi:predicted transcriptional regulator